MSDITQTNPTDPTGLNDLSAAGLKPAISRKLQYLSNANVWTDLTATTMGILSSVDGTTSCMSALTATTFGFTLNCSDNSKFGVGALGQDVYYLRYRTWYTDVTASIRYVDDPFTVTIKNACVDQTLSVTDA